MTAPPRAPDVPGYAVLGLLGTGGLGAVWRARNAAGGIVALKVVEPRRPVDAATADRIFRREALAGLNLDHPGIVRALDAVKARDGRPCIVFELAEGPTLRDAVKARGALPADEVLGIARAAASALDHAHRHGVVHGDVSPGNVLLSPGGARLLDFGLVAELEAEPGGSVFATPGFTAPEVLAGGAPTAASDLFALGRTLAFALLGRTPEGDGDLEVPGAEPGLRAVLDRLGKRDPAGRYRSAAELGLDLDAVRAGEAPLGAALAGAKARMAARRTGPWILAGVALAAVAGFLLLRDGPPAPVLPPPPSPPAPAPDPLAGKIEALRVLLGRDPVDFGAARSLAAEIREAGREDPVLAELDARWREAAAALAARKNAEAQAALTAGDRAAWRKVMLEWPPDFADAPEAAAMRAQWERWDAAARAMAAQTEKVLAESEKALEAGTVADPAALDADLARMQEDPATPPNLRRRAGELRAKAGAAAAAATKAAKEQEVRDAVFVFVKSAAKPDPMVQVQARLLEAIAKAEGTETHEVLEELRLSAGQAQRDLRSALGRLVGKTWMGYVDGRLFVGVVETPPTPESVIVPVNGLCPELRSIVRDPAMASAWLLTAGWVKVAKGTAPAGSPCARVLALLPEVRQREGDPDFAYQRWWAPVYGVLGPPRPAENPAKARAIDAYLADDLVGAWRHFEEARRGDWGDAEVKVLGARLMIALGRPFPTTHVRVSALELGQRARGLDPSLPSATAIVKETALALYEDTEPRYIEPLITALDAMENSIEAGREPVGNLMALAERFHRSGDDTGAKVVIQMARKLRAPVPNWAEELLR